MSLKGGLRVKYEFGIIDFEFRGLNKKKPETLAFREIQATFKYKNNIYIYINIHISKASTTQINTFYSEI